jgi:hypothetical protein
LTVFYLVSNAMFDALGIRPDTEQHAIHLLEEHVAPEVARLRAIDAVVLEQLGATDATQAAAAIAKLKGGS